MNQALTYHLTAELLASLEAEGYPLGTGKHLQVQELLHRLPKDADAESLRLALCPLIARNPQEQARVYEMFDECRKRVEAMMPTDMEGEPSEAEAAKESAEKELKKWRWRIIIPAAILVLLAAAGLYFYFREKPATETPVIEKPTEQQPDSIQIELPLQSETSNQQQPIFQPKTYPYDHDLAKYAITPPPVWQAWLFTNWWWLRWALLFPFTLLLVAIWRYLEHKRRKLIAEREPKDQPPYFWNIRIEGGDEILTGESFAYALQVMRRRTGADTFALDLPRTIHATAERGGLPEFRFREQTQPVDYLLLIDRQSIQNHRARLFDTLYQAFREQEIEMARFFYDSDMRVCFNEEHAHGVGLQELQQRYGAARLLLVGTGAQLISPLSGKLAPWTSLFAAWKQRALFTPKPLADWGRLERRLPEIFTVLPATLQSLSFWVEELEDGQDARFEEWRTRVKDAPQLPIHPDANDPMPLLRLHYDTPMLQWIAACAIYPSLHWDLTLWLGRQIVVGSEQSFANSTPSIVNRAPSTEEGLLSLDNLLHLFRLPWFVEGEIPAPARAALLNWLEHEHSSLLLHLRAELALLLQHSPPPQASAASDDYQMNIALNEWLTTPDERRKKELEQKIAQLMESGAEADFTVLKYLERPRTPLDFVVPDAWKKYAHPSGYAGLGWTSGLPWVFAIGAFGYIGLLWPVSENDLLVWTAVIMVLFMRQSQRLLNQPNEELTSKAGGSKAKSLNLRRLFYTCLGLTAAVLITGLIFVSTRGLQVEEENYDCSGELVKYNFSNKKQWNIQHQSLENQALICLNTKEKRVVYLEWLIREAIESGDIKKADSLSAKRAEISRIYIPKSISDTSKAAPGTLPLRYFMPLLDSAMIDNVVQSIYRKGDKNIGVALFNRGVALYQAGQRDSACYYFQSALNFDSTDADFREGVEWCNAAQNDPNGTPSLANLQSPLQSNVLRNSLHFFTDNPQIIGEWSAGRSGSSWLRLRSDGTSTISAPNDGPLRRSTLTGFWQYFNSTLKISQDSAFSLMGRIGWQDDNRFIIYVEEWNTSGLKRGQSAFWPFIVPSDNDSGEEFADVEYRRVKPQVSTDTGSSIVTLALQPKMVIISEGTFTMGSTDGNDDEKPIHSATISSFFIGKSEVTFEEYDQFCDKTGRKKPKNQGSARGKNPVVNVSWLDAVAYCNWLSKSNNLTPCYSIDGKNVTCNWAANGYRLPTEAEWEYAAKGGTAGKKYIYSGGNSLEDIAWFTGNAGGKTHLVGQKTANELGIHDMSGNVWEWCWDWKGNYDSNAATNPKGPSRGGVRVFRGGGWADSPFYCRTTVRYSGTPDHQSYSVGFRVARNNR